MVGNDKRGFERNGAQRFWRGWNDFLLDYLSSRPYHRLRNRNYWQDLPGRRNVGLDESLMGVDLRLNNGRDTSQLDFSGGATSASTECGMVCGRTSVMGCCVWRGIVQGSLLLLDIEQVDGIEIERPLFNYVSVMDTDEEHSKDCTVCCSRNDES